MAAWTYEGLRDQLSRMTRPASEDAREVLWIESRRLGVALSSVGGFEIFIAGPKLKASTSAVRRHLQYDVWRAANAQEGDFKANRVVLPQEPHFMAVAALIVIELLRAGFGTERSEQDAFLDVEPLIEMALRRGTLSDESLVGLIGELLCLEQLLLAVSDRPELRSSVLDIWRGHQHSARDFVVGSVGVEVKTTTLTSSTHVAHSLMQIEPGRGENRQEARLILLSIGLCRTEEVGVTLPELTERILTLLADTRPRPRELNPNQQRFLADLSRYGSHGPGEGYDHQVMRDSKAFSTAFTPTFVPRLYDLTDDEVLLLRHRDIEGTFVVSDQVEYGFALPDRVNATNPAPSWQGDLRELVRSQLGIAAAA